MSRPACPRYVWALYGYRTPAQKRARKWVGAAYAATRDELPHGGWSNQGLIEEARRIDLARMTKRRRENIADAIQCNAGWRDW